MKNCKDEKNFKNEEKYRIKYVFKEDSNVNVNDVIKECFMMCINKK